MRSVSTIYPMVNATWAAAPSEWHQYLSDPPRRTAYELGANDTLYHVDTIDLSAFFVQHKTFFPTNVEIMEPGLNLCGPDAAAWNNSAAVTVLEVVSSTPLDIDQTIDDLVNEIYPGTSLSNIDMQFILYGRLRMFSADVNSSFPGLVLPVATQNFGSGLPTAAEKLFSYRFVYPQNMTADLATLRLAETKLTFVGVADKEDEVPRIYRLRQSYEQNQG